MIGSADFSVMVAILLAVALAAMGMLFLVAPMRAFALSGHQPAALAGVMGGRYVGLAILVLGFLYLGETKALAFAFFIGAGFGFLDALLTRKAGGNVSSHVAAGLVSLALALVFANKVTW